MSHLAKVGVIGAGFVGNAIWRAAYESGDVLAMVYDIDPDKSRNPMTDIIKSDIIFVCVPTNNDGKRQDLRILDAALHQIQDNISLQEKKTGKKETPIVVIKSTVLPGTTSQMQKDFPGLILLHCPEFLDARTAFEDFKNPAIAVIGVPEGGATYSADYASLILSKITEVPHWKVFSSEETEMIKYSVNVFFCFKNACFNLMRDLCDSMGMDNEAFNKITNQVCRDRRTGGKVHMEAPGYDGQRGFGGACLPKDIQAFATFAKGQSVDTSVVDSIIERNNDLRGIE